MRNHYRIESMGNFKWKWQLTCNGFHVEYFNDKDVADRVCDELNANEILKQQKVRLRNEDRSTCRP